MILQQRTTTPRSLTNERTSSRTNVTPRTSHFDIKTVLIRKARQCSYFTRWILLALCLSALTLYIVTHPYLLAKTSQFLREQQIQWILHTKPRKLVSAECAVEESEIESKDQDVVRCTHKGHWDYIWFQHVRKAGGSSVCQMLRDNGIAAQRHIGDARNCGLYQWDLRSEFVTDLEGLKCM